MYNKKLLFWSSCAGMLLFGIVLITLGAVAPDLKYKLSLDELSAGTLFAILPFGILAGSLIFGPVADRKGFKMILVLSCVIMFAGFEGIALAGTKTLLQACILLIGFGGGIINGATNAVVSDISDGDRSANLSLLGVFFGIGALGMPAALGMLRGILSFETIVAATGGLTLATGLLYLFIAFPPPKQKQNVSFSQARKLISDNMLLLIAAFLFFQSSFEGLINNWSTTYLIDHRSFLQSRALFSLSAYVAGMSVMRLVMGTLLKKVSPIRMLAVSFIIILAGTVLMRLGNSFPLATAGMFLTGAGLAAGFPVMLGIVGDRFGDLSGTAFSFVLFAGLTGNILLNYGMGIISRNFGIRHLNTVVFIELALQVVLFVLIIRKTGDRRRETEVRGNR